MNEKPKKPKLSKVLTVANILNQAIVRIDFTGEWFEAFRKPQNKGFWFIWGTSGSGKSYFVMLLCKALAILGYKVFYNTLEEDTDDTDFIDRVGAVQMNEVEGNFWAKTFNYNDTVTYLKANKKYNVIVIDSATYFFDNFDQYLEFKALFKDRIVIITGHANGKNPRTKLEEDIMYDAKMKIYTNGYLAICRGRTIGPNGGRFIIYKKGFEDLNGQQPQN